MNAIIHDLFGVDTSNLDLELTRPEANFGDISTNVALRLSKELGKQPRIIAQDITARLLEDTENRDWLEGAEVAGPGFINITYKDAYLISSINSDRSQPYAGQKIVIETNNPNPFKDIHIGHAMNAIVSDTIANLLEAGGAEVHRVSYHGDVGLHVAKSLWAITHEFPADTVAHLEALAPEDRILKLREWYAQGAKAYDEDESAKHRIEELTKETFHFSDDNLRAIYELGKQWSFAYFDETFKRLGSKPVERPYLESQTDEKGRAIVEANIGKVFEKSDGAVIFPGERYGLHTRVFISSRGTTLYESRDLGLMALKENDYHPDKSYIVTAVEQDAYFKVVFKAAAMASPETKDKTVNIATGTVKLSTGKMSSRTGEVVNISWLFEKLGDALKELNPEGKHTEETILAALRYSFLKNRLTSDTVFDINQAISIEGNTGPYLLYAYARARTILRKSTVKPVSLETIPDLEPDERALIAKLTGFNDAVEKAVIETMPHHITGYLSELSRELNSFYEKNRVIGSPRESIRAALLTQFTTTLQEGLQILGIEAVEEV